MEKSLKQRLGSKASTYLTSALPRLSAPKCRWCYDGDHSDWDCSICTEGGKSREPNPLLCKRCQPWDDLVHVVFCKDAEYADLDPVAFRRHHCDVEVDEHAASGLRKRLSFHRNLRTLTYHPLSFFSRKCIVCRFVVDTFAEHHIQGSEVQVAIWRPFPCDATSPARCKPKDAAVPWKNELCVLPVCLSTPCPKDGKARYEHLALEMRLVYRDQGRGLQGVIPLDIRFFNPDILISWLEDCRKHHGDQCNAIMASAALPPSFRVIDTTLNCLVQPKHHITYAALSYQWKTATKFEDRDLMLSQNSAAELELPSSLKASRLPEVIVDAMQVCRDIGQRYLWVDRLCIVQDDDVLKQPQIEAMDVIYQTADVTLVACANGVGAGLPGSSTRPRHRNLQNTRWMFGIDGHMVGASPLSEEVDSSDWNKRGWTFQERLLSRRHIFFGDDFVHINCYHAAALIDPELTPATKFPPSGSGEKGLRLAHYDEFDFSRYSEIAAKYGVRTLGFRSDILKAFRGVANVLGMQLSTRFLFGIPERYMSQGILWSHTGDQGLSSHQLGLPTWSWAAWHHAPKYPTIFSGTFRFLDLGSPTHFGNIIQIYYCDESRPLGSRVRRLEEKQIWFEDIELAHLSREQWEERMVLNTSHGGFLDRSEVETWKACIHGPWEAQKHQNIAADVVASAEQHPHCLVFNTTIAQLRLDETPEFGPDEGDYCRLGIYDNNTMVGETVLMHRVWAKRHFATGAKYHVFAIAAGHMAKSPRQTSVFLEDKHPVYRKRDPWAFFVMVTALKGGVYKRITVGSVNPNSWTALNPRWEPVILV